MGFVVLPAAWPSLASLIWNGIVKFFMVQTSSSAAKNATFRPSIVPTYFATMVWNIFAIDLPTFLGVPSLPPRRKKLWRISSPPLPRPQKRKLTLRKTFIWPPTPNLDYFAGKINLWQQRKVCFEWKGGVGKSTNFGKRLKSVSLSSSRLKGMPRLLFIVDIS